MGCCREWRAGQTVLAAEAFRKSGGGAGASKHDNNQQYKGLDCRMQTNMLRMSDSADKQMQNRRRNTGGHVKVVKEAVTAEVGYRRGSTRLQLLGRCRGVHPSATAIGGAICPQRPLPLRPGIAIGSIGDEAADYTPIWSSLSLGGHASGNGCTPRSPQRASCIWICRAREKRKFSVPIIACCSRGASRGAEPHKIETPVSRY
jgi:hypothetical protein